MYGIYGMYTHIHRYIHIIHTHRYIHIYITYIHTHTYIHTYRCSSPVFVSSRSSLSPSSGECIFLCMYVCMCKYNTPVWEHTSIHTHTYISAKCIYIHTYMPTYIPTYIPYIHTYIDINIQNTYIHRERYCIFAHIHQFISLKWLKCYWHYRCIHAHTCTHNAHTQHPLTHNTLPYTHVYIYIRIHSHMHIYIYLQTFITSTYTHKLYYILIN